MKNTSAALMRTKDTPTNKPASHPTLHQVASMPPAPSTSHGNRGSIIRSNTNSFQYDVDFNIKSINNNTKSGSKIANSAPVSAIGSTINVSGAISNN
jgi:hypothetical protein